MSHAAKLATALAILVLAFAPTGPLARKAPSPVVTGTVPFQAGEMVPDFPHEVIKLRSLSVEMGKPGGRSRKIKVTIKVENFGEKDYHVILTAALLNDAGLILASRTDKEDVDDNDRTRLSYKFSLPEEKVESIRSIRLELSTIVD